MALLISLLALAGAVTAVPSINLPINAQVPPVARVSKAFDFIFSETTFASSAPSMTYVLSNSTSWLHLDGPSRTLLGTPGPEDVGSVTINLVACDDTGSASMQVTLVVSAELGPRLGTPLETQLSKYGASSTADTIILSHSSPLSLSFMPDTFMNTNDKTVYYAVCANNTPLPSWLAFNPIDLSFSGTTPESTSPVELSQTFGIKLIASDVAGFAGAIAILQFVIESHSFVFGKSSYTFNITPGNSFNYTGLQTDLLFDGVPVKPLDMAQITAQTPSWMVLDMKTLAVSGTAPLSAIPQNITVSATDVYQDKADTIIFVQTASGTLNLFNDAIDTLNATIGSDFNYDLNGILNTSPGLNVTVDVGNASSWLKFESNKLELTGHVPGDTRPHQILLGIMAHQGSQNQSKAITLNLAGEEGGTNSGIPSPSQSSAAIATPSTTTQPRSPVAATVNNESTRYRKEAVCIAVPLVLIVLGVLVLALCLRRRRQQRLNRGYLDSSKEKISYPIQTTEHREVSPEEGVLETGTPAYKRVSLLPRIDWRRSQLRSSRATENSATEISKPESWQEEVVRAIPDFSLLPEERPPSQISTQKHPSSIGRSKNPRISSLDYGSPSKRLSKQIKRHSHINRAGSLLLSTHRVSGVGHGYGGFNLYNSSINYSTMGAGHGIGGPPGYGRVRQSTRNASMLSGSSWATTSTSAIFNNGLSSHHLPSEPSQTASTHTPTINSLDLLSRANTIHEAAHDDRIRRPSVRTVAYRSRVHSRALSPRGAFLKRRARDRQTHNPLFSAGPSCRVSSRAQRQSTLRTQYSHSRASSSGSLGRANPYQRSSQRFDNYNLSTRVIDTLGRMSRFQSRSSFSSNNRYQSAESDTQSEEYFVESEGLQEDLDEDGNKRWRHMDNPNPLAIHRSDTRNMSSNLDGDPGSKEAASQGQRDDAAASHLELDTLFPIGERSSRARRLSYLGAHADGSRVDSGGQERRFVVGSKQKRPVSVDAHVGLRRGEGNMSMKGDVRDVAFL